MEKEHILRADFLDILFEHRNKAYGAYDLRRNYPKRILKALVISLIMAGGIFAIPLLKSSSTASADDVVVREVVVENIREVKPPPPPPPPPPKEDVAPPPKAAQPMKAPVPTRMETTKFTPPVIKKDADVRKDELPPVAEVQRVDRISSEGLKDPGVITNLPPVTSPAGVDKGTGVVEAPKPVVEDENKIFTKVEIEASVNMATWRRHLETQLQRYIEDAASRGMSPGKYTVQVRFLVERDGSISDVKALNDPGYGLAKGAVDVVKRGPKWNPGEQNGRKVRSYHTQPITFVISDGYL